jgi:hypothetical protein
MRGQGEERVKYISISFQFALSPGALDCELSKSTHNLEEQIRPKDITNFRIAFPVA